MNRRHALSTLGAGFGSLAFNGLATEQALGTIRTHHAPRAKRVICLFMHGGVSQIDSFDYKPALEKHHGERLPFSAAKNLDPSATSQLKLMQSPWKFQRHGDSGQWVSELWPNVARHVDKMSFVKSVHSLGQSHGQAVCMLHTGSDNFIRPSVGSWVSYGLGTENSDLPAFVSISPSPTHGGPRNYGSAFLPAEHQGTTVGRNGKLDADPRFAHLDGVASGSLNERKLDLLREMNSDHFARTSDPRVEGVIQSYELAFRMQGAAPGVMDLSGESDSIKQLYGIGTKETDQYGRGCLLARRFAEAGVRYIQVSTANVWDQHANLKSGHEKNARAVDLPIAGLLEDLDQRGLLEDTLVVWGTEFGRTPIIQGSNGRDHNPQGFTMWLAGGGVKGGHSHGATDEFGYFAVQDKAHMHDVHATILHLLGIDHEQLTYRYAGRDFRLTDVYGDVIQGILS